jgi:hypothetical protein
VFKQLLRFLFVSADKQYPNAWWCGSCREAHYLKSVAMQQNWKVP